MKSFYDKFNTLPEISTSVSETFSEYYNNPPADEYYNNPPADEEKHLIDMHEKNYYDLKKDKHKYNLFMMGYINFYKMIIKERKYCYNKILAIFMENNEFVYYTANSEIFESIVSSYSDTDILTIISKSELKFANDNEKKKYAEECENYRGKGWQKARNDLNIKTIKNELTL